MSLAVRDLGQGDTDTLQQLLESVPDYSERVTGYPPGPSDALSVLTMVPDGFDPAGKRAIGLWDGDQLVGFADVLIGYPDQETAFIGLLVTAGGRHRKGLGRTLHEAVVERARQECGAGGRLRLAIVDTNALEAEPFWRAMGYQPTGEVRPYRYDNLESQTRLWQRPISLDATAL